MNQLYVKIQIHQNIFYNSKTVNYQYSRKQKFYNIKMYIILDSEQRNNIISLTQIMDSMTLTETIALSC